MRRNCLFTQYFSITAGAALLALGVNLFLVPQKLSSGGASALGTVMLFLFRVPVSLSVLVINTVLFLLGFKYLKKSAVLKTAVGSLLFSVFLQLCTYLPAYHDDIFIAAIIGGLLSGLGIGLVVREGASTGGSDFAALIIHKLFPHISLTAAITAIDCIIVTVSGFIFRDATITVYSLISLYLTGKTADIVSVIGSKTKFAFIISKKHSEIASDIIGNFRRGVTGIYCRGMYSGLDSTMLLCAVSPREMPQLIKTVKAFDPNAFVIVCDSMEVLGEGFAR